MNSQNKNQTDDLFQYEEDLIKEKQLIKAQIEEDSGSKQKHLESEIKKLKIQIQEVEQSLGESQDSEKTAKIDLKSVKIEIDHKIQNNIVLNTVNILAKSLQ
jgi:hypothetical protein